MLVALPAPRPVAAAICAGSFGFAPKVGYATRNNPYSLAVADLNGDGRADIAVANDTGNGVSVLLASGSPGSFAPPVSYPTGSRAGSVVAGDLNGDGQLDVVVTAINAPAEIWMNHSPGGNHWLEFKLQGTRSNRDGIGARIKVVTKTGTQYNHMTTSAGYASSSAGPVHFGLGPNTSADMVEIQWPSGIVQQLRNVAGDRIVSVQEPAR